MGFTEPKDAATATHHRQRAVSLQVADQAAMVAGTKNSAVQSGRLDHEGAALDS